MLIAQECPRRGESELILDKLSNMVGPSSRRSSMTVRIDAVLTGKARRFRDEEESAIFKYEADGPIEVNVLGLEGDEQADLTVHGGIDKAIHQYPQDHYSAWKAELDDHPLLAAPGGFGENIATFGMIEKDICIGDRLRLGSALVEVSQGRSPCWKIDHKFERKGITARVVTSGRSGWYYRVIETGTVATGDALDLVERPNPEWDVARVFRCLVSGKDGDRAAFSALASLLELSEEWKAKARRKLG
jgi:MOSC domain-containing protein YiiM